MAHLFNCGWEGSRFFPGTSKQADPFLTSPSYLTGQQQVDKFPPQIGFPAPPDQ